MTEARKEILNIFKNFGILTAKDISITLNKSISAVEYLISMLLKDGYIIRISRGKYKIAINDNPVTPIHYSKLEIDPIDYCLNNNINFPEGSIIKYISRWRNKNGIEDLYKAKEFLNRLIKFEESKRL